MLPHLDVGSRTCAAFNDRIFELILAKRFDHLVIVSLWNYFDGDYALCQPVGGGCEPVAPEMALEGHAAAFIQRMQSVAATGLEITIVLPPPYSRFDLPTELARRRFLGLDRSSLEHLPQHEQQDMRARVETVLRRLEPTPGIRLIDPFDLLCKDGRCVTVDAAGSPVFRDSNHLRGSYLAKTPFLDSSLTW